MTGQRQPWEAVPAGPGMSPLQIETMLVVLGHCTSLFEEVCPHLEKGAFMADTERPYELYILALAEARQAAGRGPALPILPGILQSLHYGMSDLYPGYVYAKALELCQLAQFSPPDQARALEPWARGEVAKFLAERKVVDPLRRRLAAAKGGFILDPAGMLTESTQALATIQSLRGAQAYGVVPEGWALPYQARTSTGNSFIDRILGGGTQAGKLYGILGPSGSFKTGLAVQLAVTSAMGQYKRGQSDPTFRPGLVVYAVYEGGRDEIRLRALSCAAEIPKERLERLLGAVAPLGRQPGELEYEVDYGFRESEDSRLFAAEQTTRHLRIIDMAGPVENPSAGTGYVDELVGAIDGLVRQTGQPIAAVFIDYAKLMARRHLMSRGGIQVDRMLRHYIGGLPDQLRSRIADPHACPMWVLHQLNTEANKRAAGAVQHHAFSGEAGDFAENLWFAFVLSSVDKANQSTVTLHASKTRDGAGLNPIEVLRIDGVRNRLVPAEDYAYDPASRRIVSRAALSAVADVSLPDFGT